MINTIGISILGLAIGTIGAIIYLSAMDGIDAGLYEAAQMDGATRLQRSWNITLPGIRPTIIVLLIMSIGSALNVGMER